MNTPNDTRPATVYSLISAVMADMSKVGVAKNQKNTQQGFMYRGVDGVMNALAPILSKHGLIILPRVKSREVTERESKTGAALFYVVLVMEFDFISASDGSTHTVGPIYGEAMDSGDKASNKAMSIAYKYACFQVFCIPTEAIDPDAETHEVKRAEEPEIASMSEKLIASNFVAALEWQQNDPDDEAGQSRAATERLWKLYGEANKDHESFIRIWRCIPSDKRTLINNLIASERAKGNHKVKELK